MKEISYLIHFPQFYLIFSIIYNALCSVHTTYYWLYWMRCISLDFKVRDEFRFDSFANRRRHWQDILLNFIVMMISVLFFWGMYADSCCLKMRRIVGFFPIETVLGENRKKNINWTERLNCLSGKRPRHRFAASPNKTATIISEEPQPQVTSCVEWMMWWESGNETNYSFCINFDINYGNLYANTCRSFHSISLSLRV